MAFMPSILFGWQYLLARYYDLLYPMVNKYNYNAQAKHLEAIRTYLRVNKCLLGLRQLEYLQTCIGDEKKGPCHAVGNDEYLESNAIRNLKMATKQRKMPFAFLKISFEKINIFRNNTIFFPI